MRNDETYTAMDLRDLDIDSARFEELVNVSVRPWQGEVSWNEIFFDKFGKRAPGTARARAPLARRALEKG